MNKTKMINPIVIDEDRSKLINESKSEKNMVNPIVIDKKNHEEKEYLILLIGPRGNEEEFKDYHFVTGRTAAYDLIKTYISKDECSIDLDESYVLTEGVDLKDKITVYEFMIHIQVNFFKDDDLNIDKYHNTDNYEISDDGSIMERTSYNSKDYI